MLQILRRGGVQMEPFELAPGAPVPDDVVWIDLNHPSREEELALEAALAIDVPTREDMAEIEASSRLYQERGATYMTAVLIYDSEGDAPSHGPVTFVLAGERLITVRYVEPRSFALLPAQAVREAGLTGSGVTVFLGLLELVVDRTADLLERLAARVDHTGRAIVRQEHAGSFKPVLKRLVAAQGINAMARDSLVSLARLMSFAQLCPQLSPSPGAVSELAGLQRDVQSLNEHSAWVSGNIGFLLNASLGLISVTQNEITKAFSIAAVVLLPPTLVGAWWGMNFRHMPELDMPEFYPWGPLAVMLLSAAVPFLWFKRKGWL